jgi:hypothetical protein
VALTAVKLKNLTGKDFPKLFTKHKALWGQKAKQAYLFTKASVVPTGQLVRPDDVLPLLESTLELVPEFYDHLADKRLTQLYWKTRFAEYILDQLWTELEQESEKEAEDDGEGTS